MSRRRALLAWWRRLLHGRWVVARHGAPNGQGYALYRPRDRVLLQHSIWSRDRAQEMVDRLNRYDA